MCGKEGPGSGREIQKDTMRKIGKVIVRRGALLLSSSSIRFRMSFVGEDGWSITSLGGFYNWESTTKTAKETYIKTKDMRSLQVNGLTPSY